MDFSGNNDFQKSNSKGGQHCLKSVRIWSCSGPYFPAFGLNRDQNNSEYGRFLQITWVKSRIRTNQEKEWRPSNQLLHYNSFSC